MGVKISQNMSTWFMDAPLCWPFYVLDLWNIRLTNIEMSVSQIILIYFASTLYGVSSCNKAFLTQLKVKPNPIYSNFWNSKQPLIHPSSQSYSTKHIVKQIQSETTTIGSYRYPTQFLFRCIFRKQPSILLHTDYRVNTQST